jgi:hypothetical protein
MYRNASLYPIVAKVDGGFCVCHLPIPHFLCHAYSINASPHDLVGYIFQSRRCSRAPSLTSGRIPVVMWPSTVHLSKLPMRVSTLASHLDALIVIDDSECRVWDGTPRQCNNNTANQLLHERTSRYNAPFHCMNGWTLVAKLS